MRKRSAGRRRTRKLCGIARNAYDRYKKALLQEQAKE